VFSSLTPLLRAGFGIRSAFVNLVIRKSYQKSILKQRKKYRIKRAERIKRKSLECNFSIDRIPNKVLICLWYSNHTKKKSGGFFMETQRTAAAAAAAEEITFSLRISGELNEKIIAAAREEKRSRQAHIVYSLEKLFADAAPLAESGIGKKEKAK
jgi:hypothetical protein